MATLPTISRFLALFQEIYPITELTDLTAEAWMIALEDVGDQEFTWAARRVLREDGRKFFPTPNEVRSFLAPPDPRCPLVLPSNDPVAKGVDAFYAAQQKTSKRLSFADASDSGQTRQMPADDTT